jgi:hypothetical protein
LKEIGREENQDNLIKYLERIDFLFTNARLENSSQRTIFEDLFKGKEVQITAKKTIDWLFLDKGTSTPRYWFFKLDYLLWKDTDRYKYTFQFRQNRSVEHVHAQSQNNEINNEWSRALIDSFGNLALISVSSNSQNNDNSFKVKKALFKQRSEKYGYESLKLALIFENDNWTETECRKHKEDMIEILNKSFEELLHRHESENSTT